MRLRAPIFCQLRSYPKLLVIRKPESGIATPYSQPELASHAATDAMQHTVAAAARAAIDVTACVAMAPLERDK